MHITSALFDSVMMQDSTLLRQAQSQLRPLQGVTHQQRNHQIWESTWPRNRAVATLDILLQVGTILIFTWLLVRSSDRGAVPCAALSILVLRFPIRLERFASVIAHGNDSNNAKFFGKLPCLITAHAALQCFVLLMELVPRREAKLIAEVS